MNANQDCQAHPGHWLNFFAGALFAASLLLLAVLPAAAAPLSPGTVIAPIDKPVYQPERKLKPAIVEPEKKQPAVPSSTLTVPVNRFLFRGNTTFSDEQLQEVVSRYEGRDLSITDIYRVADMVEIYYRYNGYLLTSVYVPAQQINSGEITLEIIEGRLGEINISGNLHSYSPAFLRKQINELTPGEIIADQALEKETLLLGDLPGLDARAVISPGKEYGQSDIDFVVEEDRYSGVINANNYGRKSIGEARIEAGVLMANPVFEGDAINLSFIGAQDSRMYYGRVDYDALINVHGSRLGFSYSAFNYDVDTPELGFPDTATLGGGGTTAVLRFSHPLQRSSRNNATLLVNVRRSTTRENGNISLRPDTGINLLDVFLSWDHLYRDYARTAIQGGISTNFQSRTDLLDDGSQKAKLTLDMSHYQPFLKTWFILGRIQATYSPDPLVDVERFRIGGQGSVRAYPSAELAGDRGGVISLDLGWNYVASDSIVMVPKVFLDAGRVYRIEPVGLAARESLAGYGAGLLVVVAKDHNFDFEVVTPSNDKPSSDGRDTRFWLSYRGLF